MRHLMMSLKTQSIGKDKVMWISEIELKNFKSYESARFEFSEPKDGKNIVIIGAKNGHGKTTLLEAIYLGLYDEDAMSHFDRAGLSEKRSLKEYLNHALHNNATPQYHNQYIMQVAISLKWRNSNQQIEGIKIARRWWFGADRQILLDNNEKMVQKIDGLSAMPLEDDEASRLMQTHALPVDYAPFFFFDGEKIINIARTVGAGNWLNKALRGLTGVVLLEQLKETLHDYKTQYIKAVSTRKVQAELDKLGTEFDTLIQKIDEVKCKREQAIISKTKFTKEQDELMQVLGQGSDIKTTQDVINQISQTENDYKKFEDALKSAIKSMPMALLPKNEIDKLIVKLEREKNRLDHEAGKEQIEGRVDDFWRQFVSNNKVKDVLGRSAQSILNDELMKEAVKECWELLFYPLPDGCADVIEHNYLSQTAHAKIVAEYHNIDQYQIEQSIGTVVQDMQKAQYLKDALSEELNNLKSSDNDQKVARLKEVRDELEYLNQEIGLLDGQLNSHQERLKTVKSDQDKCMGSISENNPKVQKANRAKIIENFIDDLTQKLTQAKVEEVSDKATLINARIAHDRRIDRIVVHTDGKMQLFSQNGDLITSDLSAGQMQVLMMSLISAMAEVTDFQMPFVIDTPLARLDKEHRQNIFEHWQSLSQQVILLSQDTEITTEVARLLAPSISKTYLVTATSLTKDGAVANIESDVYFS